MHQHSPLRYPGGKARVANFMRLLCACNGIENGTYVEPYAGGASVGLYLLAVRSAGDIYVNDVDPGIAAFWRAVVDDTERLCGRIQNADLSVDEWRRQQTVWRSESASDLERGFATFYLNRVNRSGIIAGAGLIGGVAQEGRWKMDARFPVAELIRRIRAIAREQGRIHVRQQDALALLEELRPQLDSNSLIYLDPPYYEKGQQLYRNSYSPEDHAQVAEAVGKLKTPWVVSYDDHPAIRSLYGRYRSCSYPLRYSASRRYNGGEIMFFSPNLAIPEVPNPAALSRQATATALRSLYETREAGRA